MWYCRKCGHQNRDEAGFCVKCGDPRPVMQKAPAETYKPAGKGKKKTSAKGTVGLIIEALAAAAACALLVVSYRTYMDPGAAAEKYLEAVKRKPFSVLFRSLVCPIKSETDFMGTEGPAATVAATAVWVVFSLP